LEDLQYGYPYEFLIRSGRAVMIPAYWARWSEVHDIFCNMKTIAITMEEDDLKRIDKVAGSRTGTPMNRSQFIREAVRDYLARIEKTAEEEREREIFSRNRHRLHQQALALIKEQAKP